MEFRRRAHQHLEACRQIRREAGDLFQVGGAFLDPDDIGVLRKLHHHFQRKIDAGHLRKVINQHR